MTCEKFKIIIYTNDTTIYHNDLNLGSSYENVSIDPTLLNDRFRAYKLSVNASKTKYIMFKKQLHQGENSLILYIEYKKLEKVCYTKYLDVFTDENMT